MTKQVVPAYGQVIQYPHIYICVNKQIECKKLRNLIIFYINNYCYTYLCMYDIRVVT